MQLPTLEAHTIIINLELLIVVVHALDDQHVLIVECIALFRLFVALGILGHRSELILESSQLLQLLRLLDIWLLNDTRLA